MTEDTSPENLRKFLEGDDPAMRRMGLSMAKGAGVPEELYKNVFGLSLWDPEEENREAAADLVEEIGLDNITEFPEWLEPFEEEDVDRPVLYSAARALGKIGKPAVEPLIGVLDDAGVEGVRSAAAKALGEIGDVRAVEPLIKALGDEKYYGRGSAAEALGKIGDACAVQPLIKALGDRNSDVCYHAAEALGKIGDARAVQPLKDKGFKTHALWSLKDVPGLVKALGDGDEDAAKALGAIGDAQAVEPLIQALEKSEESDEGLNHEIIFALGKIGDDRAVEPLIEMLENFDAEDYDSGVEEIIEALGDIGGEKAILAIADGLTDRYDGEYHSYDSTVCAAATLTKIGKPAVRALMEFVTMMYNDTAWPTMDIPISTLEIKENAARIIVDILGTRKATDLLLNAFVLPVDEHGGGSSCGNEEYDGYYEGDWQCDACYALETCFCILFALSESEDKRFLESAEKLQKYIDADSQKELYSDPEIEERYGGGKSDPFIYLGRHFDSYQKLLDILK